MFAILGDEHGLVDKKNPWGAIFEVEQPRFKVTHVQGKFVDVNEALEVARFDIQYCDWRARQDRSIDICELHFRFCLSCPVLN